jgi:hypothetical protein
MMRTERGIPGLAQGWASARDAKRRNRNSNAQRKIPTFERCHKMKSCATFRRQPCGLVVPGNNEDGNPLEAEKPKFTAPPPSPGAATVAAWRVT